MEDQFSRTRLLIGEDGLAKLRASRVAVFGVGGVGGFVCEALVRSGIGAFDLIDNDVVSLSNLNRQIIALQSTVGRPKVEVMLERMRDINPDVEARTYQTFVLRDNVADFPFDDYDYVIDAVDTVQAKLELVVQCREQGVPIISSMGAGNKLDAGGFKVTDIYKTKMDPLARVMRRELRKRGVERLKVVYSEAEPVTPMAAETESTPAKPFAGGKPSGSGAPKKRVPGSIAFVPSVAGLIIAGEVVKDILNSDE